MCDNGTTTEYAVYYRGWEEWVSGIDDLMAVQRRWEQVSIRTRPSIWAYGFVAGRNWCINQLQRARSIKFESVWDNEMTSLRERFKIDISNAINLERFECEDKTTRTMTLCISKGARLPKLTRLSIQGYHYDRSPPQTPTINDFSKIAECMPPLEELDLRFPMIRENQRPKSVFRISTLRKLVLRIDVFARYHWIIEPIREFFHHVEFPSLQILELDLIDRAGEADILSSITSMLHRSNAKIKVLQICNDSWSERLEDVYKFLESLPTVHKLIIGGHLIHGWGLLERLNANTDGPVLLPLLQTLAYLHPWSDFNPLSLFGLFLLSRSPPDGEDYPPEADEKETENEDTVIPLSRSGTSVLRKVIIDRRNTRWPECWEAKRLIEKSTVVADLHRRGLVFEEL